MASQHKPAPPGELVDVGGFRLHALVSGQGSPVVLLEPALGGFAQQYAHIQKAVSACTRVMAYDRAGQGWSDPSPNPRTPAHLADEWQTLLERLDLQPPYVLVGHSFGGLLVRVYAGLHPEWVVGMVLVDAIHVDEYAPFPDLDKMTRQMATGVGLLKVASRLGLGRPVAKLSLGSAAKALSPEDLEAFLTVAGRPKHQETALAEFSQHRFYLGSGSQVPPSLGDIPLLVVTAGESVSGSGRVGGITNDQMNALHQRLQKGLVGLSPQGEQVILPTASHLSILVQPEHVARVAVAIRGVVDKSRIAAGTGKMVK